MNNHKKILIVTFFFSPYAEVGAVRMAKVVKYLSKLGWNISVICSKEKYYNTINDSYVKDVETAKVIRTKRLPKFIPKFKEDGFYWSPFVFYSIIKTVIKNRPNIILYSGGPFFHWFIAPLIKKIFKINYILDMRDAFYLNPYLKPITLPNKLGILYSKYTERFSIKHAEAVIGVNDFAVNLYKEHYPQYANKMKKFSNGFDPDDFKNVKTIPMEGFNIVYSGKFGNFRDPRPFFDAFSKIISVYKLEPKDIHFHWIGNAEDHIVEYINTLKLESYINYTGFLSYAKNLEYINSCSMCLLVAGNHPYEQTTKIFDYAALNKPILGLVPADGFLKKELGNYERGFLCRASNDVFNAISYTIQNSDNKPLQKNNMKEFNRKNIIEELDLFLKSLI